MEVAEDILHGISGFVWGPFMLALLVGTGVFLSIRLKFLPWRNLGYALKSVFRKPDQDAAKGEGDITPFQSLMTALAATIGTGNIVGVATAMVLGGPGALVWMWLSALFGLSTKYAESLLAVKYREVNQDGEMSGGPMYVLRNAFPVPVLGKVLAVAFALFAVMASFGIGNMTQANSIADALNTTFHVPKAATGALITVLVLVVLMGGIKSIGSVCGKIVPFMAGMYFVSGILVILLNIRNVPSGIAEIVSMAFSVKAVSGGVGGTVAGSMLSSIRWGVARGVFSNEAGLGSAPIAAAAAQTDMPSRQGYINMTGTFFDTIVVCTVTGLVIASSGQLGMADGSTGELLTGAALTISSFRSGLGSFGGWMVSIGIMLFAFSTILGWEYYGEKSLEFLAGSTRANKPYRVVFALITFVGATQKLAIVWDFSDAMNGLMAIPNLVCLLALSGVVAKECFAFQDLIQKERER